MKLLEQHFENCTTLFVLIHGVESSKEEWLEIDGYTKGGNLTSFLADNKLSWIAVDLYGHGSYTADEKELNVKDISDDLWSKFVTKSVEAVKRASFEAIKRYNYTEVSLVTYSGGSLIGMYFLKEVLPCKIETVYMASYCPEREYDDEYSMHNNLDVFKGKAFYGFSGTMDEDVPIDDANWVFAKIPSECKEHFIYQSGHSLPLDWVKDFQKLVKNK